MIAERTDSNSTSRLQRGRLGGLARACAALVLSSGFAVVANGQVAAPASTLDIRVTNYIVPQCAGARAMVVRPGAARVEVTGVETTIDILDGVAATTLRMTVSNSGSTPEETQLLLPVPDSAAIRNFGFDGPGQEPTAKLLPRDEARRIYEEIVRKVKDPALLEFVGYNLVRSSIFPVPAQGRQTITLTYEQILGRETGLGASAGDRIDYFLPRSASLEQTSAKWSISGSVRTSAVRNPEGKGQVRVATVYSPSHQVSTRRVSDRETTFEVAATPSMEPGTFRLCSLLERPDAAKDSLTTSIMAYPDFDVDRPLGERSGEGYFLFLAGVPSALPNRDDAVRARREVIIVLDRSGSMRNEKIEQARNAAAQILDGLREGEAFNIIDYSDSIQKFAERPVIKDHKSIREAREYLTAVKAEGGTNIHGALQEAMHQPVTADGGQFLPMVIFLTDGLPTVGVTDEATIRNDTSKANEFKRRIFTFGVGVDVNAPLLDRIAETTRGASINVLPGENIEVAVSRVFKRLEGPILSEPRLIVLNEKGEVDTRAVRNLMPAALPDLFEGDQLVVLGQFAPMAADRKLRFRLEGKSGETMRQYDIDFDVSSASTRSGFVARLWAARRIANLVDEIRQAGTNGGPPEQNPRTRELVQEIVRLSTRWGILTEYTSFLATEPVLASTGAPAPMTPGRAADMATENLAKVATVRAGSGGVSQSMNIKEQQLAACTTPSNRYWDSNMRLQQVATVQQAADQTLFCRGKRWVDSRILAKDETEKPDREVDFGSDEHFELARRLAAEEGGGRASLLAVQGEVYLLIDGQRVLIKAPTTN